MIVVQAVPGREDYTRATCWSLDAHGGASSLDVRPFLYWTGPDAPGFDLPPGWTLVHSMREREGHRRDLWRLFGIVPADADLLVLEDDVIPCRNAIPYMARWTADLFTTFFNMRGLAGPQKIDRRGFQGTQAIRIPSRLVRRLVDAGPNDPRLPKQGGDTRLDQLLRAWGEPIYYHRSLVQHVGRRSVCNPSATLTGLRAPAVDFDVDFDPLRGRAP